MTITQISMGVTLATQVAHTTSFPTRLIPMIQSPFVWNGGLNFTHSVASGDPFDTSVLLWTRAVPALSTGALPDQSVPVCVSFKISTSNTLSPVIDSGEAFTSYDVDFTVKVEATGLQPDTRYFFQFSDCTNAESVSPVGATRTFASPDTPADQVNGGKPLTFAVFSCSQFQAGYFNAYGFAAQNTTADVFVHLGDYIYESIGSGGAIGRAVLGRQLATIHDYRQRFQQYRTDVSLSLAHQSAPWITTWDDHEVANNAWKAGTSNSNDTAAGCSFSPSGACFTDRKLAAIRAYHEWLPVRQVDTHDLLRIWRNFQVGKLLWWPLWWISPIAPSWDSPKKNVRFADTLSESKRREAIWRVVGQQVVFSQLNGSSFRFNTDAWDGYRANRARILDHLYNNEISNTVILAGDSHANWVSDLARPNDTTTYNPITGDGAIGVEFAGTAVTSTSSFRANIAPAAADVISRQLVDINPDLQWSEGSFRGFFTLTIDPQWLNATYYAMRNITFPNTDGFASAEFPVKNGENKLHRPVAGGKVNAGALKVTVP
ncbi:hypothetical protein PLEOSDRAFT_1099298 [Pleurotus ostreatus PC15]|uniref:PhoD-like phosphatase metallophosphatase domain-containing protein n=1 Tax=Pleurotus ostreatus (strain PC15) TaxID=1137138 RepID=A0A067NZ68_PLEO1|nr:hypothetical protein PLEOSDRAFT_1099298 [Pleurotus ostreatus PC15]